MPWTPSNKSRPPTHAEINQMATAKFIEFIFMEFPAEMPLVVASSKVRLRSLPYLVSAKIANTLEIDPFIDHYIRDFGISINSPTLNTTDIVASLYSIGFTKEYVNYLYREYLKTFIR